MSLAAGTRLGPYEITALLGAGGMGEVYRAHDTRLDRDVAIKVLPEAFAADSDRRARFEREAKAVAALSHPNVLAIFDTGLHSGQLYVVTELLEGETLRARLANGALPVRKAIDIGVQIARGLTAAHDKGIVHRDLKPENVFLVSGGQVKILDFGLARTLSRGTDATETVAATDPGTVMGTVGYMAPEQVRGQTVDGRTDLFALGAVLYEMLTGRRAFQRETPAETMTAILREEVQELTLSGRADLSPAIDRVVRHCLEKDPAERFQTARDVAFALEGVSGSSGPSATVERSAHDAVAAAGQPRPTRWRTISIAAPVALLVLAATFFAGTQWALPQRDWPTEWIGEDIGGSAVAFAPRVAPNGQDVAFLAMTSNTTQVAVMRPGSGSWQVLTTDQGRGLASGVSWSLDGTRILFDRIIEQPKGVFSVPVPAGQESLILRDAGTPRELPDGDMLVTQINAERQFQLHRHRRATGQLEPLNALLFNMWSMFRVFPDGQEVAFFGRPKDAPSGLSHIYALELSTGQTRRLAPSATLSFLNSPQPDFPLAVTSTSVIFDLVSGNLHRITAAPRDGSDRLETLFTTTAEPANIDVGPDNAIYLDQIRVIEGIGWLSVEQRNIEFDQVANLVEQVLPLPDGRALAQVMTSGVGHIVAVSQGQPPTPFAPTIQENMSRPLSLVGRDRVAFLVGPEGQRQVAIVTLSDGLLVRRLTGVNGNDVVQMAGSPDGRTLFYVTAGSVWAVPTDDGTPRHVRAGDGVAVDPTGTYLVVQLNERDGGRLVRVPLDGSPEVEIPIRSSLRIPATGVVAANAVSRDGRIAVRVASPASWFWPAAILDPRTGILEPVLGEWTADHVSPGWAHDGRIVANIRTVQSRIWRFRPSR